MRALMKGLAVLAAGALVGAPLAAQQRGAFEIGAGGGVVAPTGSYNDAFDYGWNGVVGLAYALPSVPIVLQLDLATARFTDDTPLDIKENMYYGTANLMYRFNPGGTVLHPYVIGGTGIYQIDPAGADEVGAPSHTRFGVNAGAGLELRPSELGFFVEARYHAVLDKIWDAGRQFGAVTAGVRLNP